MSQTQKPNEEGRLFAILAYILPVFGGIIGLAVNRENSLTRVHAQQSIGAVLTLIAGFIIWGFVAYIVTLIPANRDIVVVLTAVMTGIGFLAFFYHLAQLPADDKARAGNIRKLISVAIIYTVGIVLVFLSQNSPDLVAFAVPVIELLSPVSELFMPVVLLTTVIILGGRIIPPVLRLFLILTIIINMLTWMPLAGPVIAISLYGLVIALVMFLMFNWGFGLLRAAQGKEQTIPIANQITSRMFSDAEKLKAAPVRA